MKNPSVLQMRKGGEWRIHSVPSNPVFHRLVIEIPGAQLEK